jgi:hypothetical protein
MADVVLGEVSWERMIRAVEKVRDRLLRAARALEQAQVPYGEKVRPDSLLPAPDVTESEATPTFRLLGLEPLVRMKLTSYRDKDRTDLRDLISVALVDASWPKRFPAGAGRPAAATAGQPRRLIRLRSFAPRTRQVLPGD